MTVKLIGTILTAICLLGCGSKTLPVEEYVRWIDNDKGDLTKHKEVGEFVYKLEYKPAEYMALKDLWNGEYIDKASFKSTLNEYEGMHYFVLTVNTVDEQEEILKIGLTQENEFYNRLYYFSNEVNKDLIMIDNNDTVTCVIHHFERMYKTTPYIKMLIGFEKKYDKSTGASVIFRDRVFTSKDVKFEYSKNNINNIPTVKF